MTIDEMIEVLQAAKRGETIQLREKDCSQWRDENPLWNFYRFEYRVKPKPRVLYRIEPVIGKDYGWPLQTYDRDHAKVLLDSLQSRRAYRIVEYVENLP